MWDSRGRGRRRTSHCSFQIEGRFESKLKIKGQKQWTRRGRSCPSGRAVQTLGISGGPPGDNCNHQEASKKEQTLPGSLWGLLGTIKKNRGRRVLCLQRRCSRFYGLFGWVRIGMVHRCLTADSCHGADAVHARRNNPLETALRNRLKCAIAVTTQYRTGDSPAPSGTIRSCGPMALLRLCTVSRPGHAMCTRRSAGAPRVVCSRRGPSRRGPPPRSRPRPPSCRRTSSSSTGTASSTPTTRTGASSSASPRRLLPRPSGSGLPGPLPQGPVPRDIARARSWGPGMGDRLILVVWGGGGSGRPEMTK